MRIYSSKPRSSLRGLGQAVLIPGTDPAAILQAISPESKVPQNLEELALSRGKFAFKTPFSLSEIAILGSTGSRPDSPTMLTNAQFVFGPRAGQALILPTEEFLGKWSVVSDSRAPYVYTLGGVQKTPDAFPITPASLDETFQIINSYVLDAQRLYNLGNYTGATVAIKNGRWNTDMAWFKLKAIRDFGFTSNEVTSDLAFYLRGLVDPLAKIEADIIRRSAFINRLVEDFVAFTDSVKAKLASTINSDVSKMRDVLLKLYRARAALKKNLPSLIFRLPPDPVIAGGLAAMVSNYVLFNSTIAQLEAGLKKENIDIKALLGVDPITLEGAPVILGVSLAAWKIVGAVISGLILAIGFIAVPYVLHKQQMEEQRRQFDAQLTLQQRLLDQQLQAQAEQMREQMTIQEKQQRTAEARSIAMQLLLEKLQKREEMAAARKQVEETLKAIGDFESDEELKKIVEGAMPAAEEAFKKAEKQGDVIKVAATGKETPWAIIALVAALVGIPSAIYLLKRK